MADAYQLFLSSGSARALASLKRAQRFAVGLPNEPLIAGLAIELEARLIALATETAAEADQLIRAKIRATQKRPDTSKGHHLVDSIESAPGPLGSVEIGLISRLDQAQRDGKPYWRAQEYGLSSGFLGRRLFGTFQPSGEAPHGAASPGDLFGIGITHDPEFVMGSQPGAGPGIIRHPIEARRFLFDGTAEALVRYREGIRRIERDLVPQIKATMSL